MGQHAADWLESKSILQAMDILPKALTSQNLAQYEADIADPASIYRDGNRRDEYLRMYGNICYDNRDQYLNFRGRPSAADDAREDYGNVDRAGAVSKVSNETHEGGCAGLADLCVRIKCGGF